MKNWGSIVALLALGLLGCASIGPRGLTAQAPVPVGRVMPVAVPAPGPPVRAAAPPVRLPEPGTALTLADVVAIALENNPATRASYHQALAAAAQLARDRAAYYPSVDFSATVTRQQQSALGGRFDYLQTSYGPAVNLNYLVLDMGGRAATAEEARLGLLAADWSHNATIANVTLEVEKTFVAYLDAKAQRAAAQDALAKAQAALEAATVRHEAGVATVAEVLQAKTALSQAQLALERISGQVLVIRGALATAMGLPADTPLDVGELPGELPVEAVQENVAQLIEQALAARPDFAAARLAAEKAAVHVRSVQAEGLPRLQASATATRSYFDPAVYANYGDSWSLRLAVSVPVFTGFETRAKVAKAREEAAVAEAAAAGVEQRLVLEVWQSYYDLQTASQLVATSRDLLASAEQSHQVALARYREGVGTILDLLTAQAALSQARAEEIAARAGWYLALAQLAHDTGMASPLLRQELALEGKENQ
jgi:outer membrane protein